jgi:DNA polymerase-1
MRHAIFDLETDGLLDEVTIVHLLVIKDAETRVSHVFSHQSGARPIAEGLELLANAELVIGHNITGYDCPVLEKLHCLVIPWQKQRDTMVLSRLCWAEQKRLDMDGKKSKKKWALRLPGQMIGRSSLEAWGYRLGMHKGDYEGDTRIADEKERKARKWEAWNPDMEAYGIQDVEVTTKLWDRIVAEEPSEESVLLETQVQHIICRQERKGFLFDEKKAPELYATLVKRKLELEAEVKAVFKPMFLREGKEFTPKKDSKHYGYCAGAPLSKVVLTDFNPTSRDHITYWLKHHYGWEPTEFTNDGKAKVDDEVIAKLPYAEAAPLKEYFMVSKRIGQLAEGNEAWLRHVKKDGRIHGSVNTNGAVTGRMTHYKPNMAQVPAGYSPYGHECRALFVVPKGYILVGCDAAALELRDLAGYMARYDDGEYIAVVLEGDKSKGTDIHSVNARALGLDPKGLYFDGESGRDIAKTWFYAFIYGAGDEKLGFILLRRKGPDAVQRGKQSRSTFLKNLPGLGKLVDRVKATAKERGHLLGLDKRKLAVRSQHAALNTLLQAAGAVQMKKAICLMHDDLEALGLTSEDFCLVATVHDEVQFEVKEEHADTVGRTAVRAIQKAGDAFNFRCPLDGEYQKGKNWAETH